MPTETPPDSTDQKVRLVVGELFSVFAEHEAGEDGVEWRLADVVGAAEGAHLVEASARVLQVLTVEAVVAHLVTEACNDTQWHVTRDGTRYDATRRDTTRCDAPRRHMTRCNTTIWHAVTSNDRWWHAVTRDEAMRHNKGRDATKREVTYDLKQKLPHKSCRILHVVAV